MGRLWTCGYNNVQMLGAWCLQDAALRSRIFRGCGHVPSLSALQAEIDRAWRLGFDPHGAAELGSVSGTATWIGSSEVWALLRSYGLRANVVRFQLSSGANSGPTSAIRSRQRPAAATGQGRGVLREVQTTLTSRLTLAWSAQSGDDDVLVETAGPAPPPLSALSNGQRALVAWVWQYFSGEDEVAAQTSVSRRHVAVVDKPPLFLQHMGHSRTIVGIERRRVERTSRAKSRANRAASGAAQSEDHAYTYMLLVLDPAVPAGKLRRALTNPVANWQSV